MAVLEAPAAFKFGRINFYPAGFVNHALTGGGDTQSTGVAPTQWMMDVTTYDMRQEELGAVRGYLAQMDEGLATIKGFDPLRRKPWVYRNTTVPGAAAAGRITGVNGNLNQASFDNLAADQVITAGDYFSMVDAGGRQFLGMFCEDKTANGSGVLGLTRVRPHIPASWDLNAVATFENPYCLMRVIPGSIEWPEMTSQNAYVASFRAQQVRIDA